MGQKNIYYKQFVNYIAELLWIFLLKFINLTGLGI